MRIKVAYEDDFDIVLECKTIDKTFYVKLKERNRLCITKPN